MKAKLLLFAVCFFASAAVTLGWIYATRTKPRPAPELKQVAQNLFITSQLEPNDLPVLGRGIRAIVDLRPDGEDPAQTSSDAMGRMANALGFRFSYVPVPHGDVPDQAVTQLAAVIKDLKEPTLMYCRSGRRAVWTLALVQAEQKNGPSAAEIRAMITKAGFTTEEVQGAIDRRIAQRETRPKAATP